MSWPLLIFTDLDGTLLDHDSYSFAPAETVLNDLKQNQVPVIINSSKTKSEILAIQKQLGIWYPFISENGAAVYQPENDSWNCHSFTQSRKLILQELAEIKYKESFAFSGFADWSAEDIAERTGLALDEAKKAADREFSEPLIWEDSEEAKSRFHKLLGKAGLTAVQGGRFLTVTGPTDKGAAMRWLSDRLANGETRKVVALGDSPNDEQMLNAADIAVVVMSKRSSEMTISGPELVIRTKESGPTGWAESVTRIIEDLIEAEQ